MKKTIMVGMMSLATVTLLCGCDDFGDTRGKGQGRIVPLIGLDSDMLGSGSGSVVSRAEGDANSEAPSTAIEAKNLSVTLTKTEGDFSKTWETVDEFKDYCAGSSFTVGEYRLSAWYGDQTSTGFECPAYFGETTVTVQDDRTSEVGLTASMSKAMFSFKFTEAFAKYMDSYTITVGGVEVAQTETRPAYVLPGDIAVEMTFTTVAGQSATTTVATVKAEAKHHYKVTVDLNGGEVGDAVLTVDWDDTLEEAEPVEIELEGLFNTEAPTITPDGFSADEPVGFVEGFVPETPLKVNIVAMGGLKSVMLETASDGLAGWPESVELLNASDATQQTLTAKGLQTRGLWRNPDRMAQIDFGGVLKYIKTNADNNTTTFTVKVADNYGREESYVLTVVAEGLILNVDPANEAMYIPSEPVEFTLEFNGADPETNVELSYYHSSRKVYVPVNNWTATAATRAAGRYTVKINDALSAGNVLKLRAKCGSLSVDHEFKTPRYTVAVEDNNVFAKYAYVKAGEYSTGAEVDPASVTFEYRAESASAYTQAAGSAEGAFFKITGLEPATTYMVRVKSDEGSFAAKFTTEAAAQLPNSDMEGWYSEKAPHSQTTGFGMDAYRWYANAQGDNFWATRNSLTTAAKSGPTPYYVSYSGTVSVDGASGKAAEISTLGYGEGSTYTKSGGICKNTAAGMLFVGEHAASSETQETIVYGKPFTSRPSSLKFKYKFASYNGESFKAYIVIENRDGENVVELGRGELISAEDVKAFTEVEVPVVYSTTALKATHAYVVFISSTAEKPSVKNVTGSKGAFGGYADARRIGNVLTVDDIALMY